MWQKKELIYNLYLYFYIFYLIIFFTFSQGRNYRVVGLAKSQGPPPSGGPVAANDNWMCGTILDKSSNTRKNFKISSFRQSNIQTHGTAI